MNTLKYIFICTAMLAAASCTGKKESMSPEAVVETFCRAVASGDFDAARSLCDTVSMNGYLENYRKVMNSLQKEDSCALAIASSILAGAEFEVNGTDRKDDERMVFYTIRTEEHMKARRAVLKKEEGEWKVREITDAK